MTLEDIINGLPVIGVKGPRGIEISGITSDSRTVAPGMVFIALGGEQRDGHAFIDDALDRGAAAVVSEREDAARKREDAVMVLVRDSRDALAYLASRFYGAPSERLKVIGITGTNGKTTTSYIVKHLLEGSGARVGLVGTIHYAIGGRLVDAAFTTPGAVDYQKLLFEMEQAGCTFVVSEVSSHALAQRRVDYTRFARAVFTNLTRDHLDYHRTMEEYFLAKKRLFAELLDAGGVAVINADDPMAPALISGLRAGLLTYAVDAGADVVARGITQDLRGMKFTVEYQGASFPVSTSLIGRPNVYNLLAGMATAVSLGLSLDAAAESVRDLPPVRGRFESIMSREGILFIVDYAHTPDALRNLLATVRQLPHRKIITVFGCGGNRDRGKRPVMGSIASEMSDFVVLTSDNPRFEEPDEILADIMRGMRSVDYVAVAERGAAVREALGRALQGDVVVVAGKGHETYQEIRGVKHPMDDRELIRSALRAAGRN